MPLIFSGCSQKSAQALTEKPALVINKLELSREELKQEYRMNSSATHEASATKGEEPEWLSRLIERELLVQEAQRLGLDRDPDFMRTIERFWKEALIKLLLDRKSEEIGSRIHVYEPEIEGAYKKLTEENGGAPVEPLSQLREEFRREVRQKKETEAMEHWINELREKAKIVVDRESVAKIG